MFRANNEGAILAYFGPKSPDAGNHPKTRENDFATAF